MSKIRELATWRLPNTGAEVRLEVFRNRDGWDSPRLVYTALFWKIRIPPDDMMYMLDVVTPEAEQAVREYFGRRLLHAKKNWNAKPASIKETYRGRLPLAEALKMLAGEMGRLKRRKAQALKEAGVTI